MIAFASPVTVATEDFRREVYESPCGRYRVVLSHCTLAEHAKPENRSPAVWYAMRQASNGFWGIVSRHRRQAAAVRSVERIARRDLRDDCRAARLAEKKRRARRRRRATVN